MVTVALGLMALLAWTPGISFAEDLGRHLLLGRIILETGRVPETNYLTYTFPDFPFVNHHWLSEVFLQLAHRLVGLNGLILWKIAMISATLALALLAVVPKRGWWLHGLAAVLAAEILGFRAHIRPELFTYLFVALFLWLFARIRRNDNPHRCWERWIFPALGLLWANLHIYFIFGLGMAGAFALERILADRTLRGLRSEAVWFACLLAACLINPNGHAGLLYPFNIFSNYAVNITENAGPLELWKCSLNPMLLALPPLSLMTLAALAVNVFEARKTAWRQFRTADAIIALAALAAAWHMARSAPLLALCSLPVIATALNALPERRGPVARLAGAAGTGTVLLLASFLCYAVVEGQHMRIFPSPIGPTPFGFGDEGRYGRLSALAREHGLKGPVFTDYNLGSLVEYELYPEPGYADNRPEAFPAEFWKNEYEPAFRLDDTWRRLVERRNINAVIVSLIGAKEGFIQTLTRNPDWALIHLDDLCAVWVRNCPANQRIIGELRFDQRRLDAYVREISEKLLHLPDVPWYHRQEAADQLLMSLYSLLCVGEGARAWPYIRQFHLYAPDYQGVHELLRVTAPPGALAKLEPVFARSAQWPLSAKQVLDYAVMQAAAGREDAARGTVARGLKFFPLSPALSDLREHLEALDNNGRR